MGSHHKKKKGTDDTRIIIADIKRDGDQDFINAALQPAYEGNTYIVPARTMIDFVNVSESIDPAQTGSAPDAIPPAQVTGLAATAISDTVINLAWTGNVEPDLNHYDVYRSTTNGFTVTLGVTVPIASPTSNSYSNTGLTATTTYYYRVGAVDNSSNRGAVSVQAQATTLGVGTILPSLELRLESNFTDTSPNALTVLLYDSNTNGFTTGQFGSAWQVNTPITPTNKDALTVFDATPIQMDTAIGFSISVWVFPVDITAGPPNRRFIISKTDDASNRWSLEIDSSGVIYFFVTKAGVDYKREITGITTGSWYHIGATFNGATNTAALYKNAVAGAASTATPQYASLTSTNLWICARHAAIDSTYFEGRLDEVRYYKSVVLTPTQITNLKNTNAP